MSISELETTPRKSRGRRPNKPTKPHPLTPNQLDGRTNAAKLWDSLAASITSDLGGAANLSSVQRVLIDAFVGVSLRLNDINTRALMGQPTNLAELALAASTLVRIATRLGIARNPRTVESSLSEYLAEQHSEEVRDEA